MAEAMVVAVLGAESTGKSTLALALQAALATDGRRVASVGEVLREFCDAHGRTPRRHEQAGIAAEQTRRIDAAANVSDCLVGTIREPSSTRPRTTPVPRRWRMRIRVSPDEMEPPAI